MQVRTVSLCAGALAVLLAGGAVAQPAPTSTESAAEAPAATPPPKPPADISQAVDENGVPAWAKRKRKAPVQNCETRPGMGIETWRERVDTSNGPERRKPRPPQATCR